MSGQDRHPPNYELGAAWLAWHMVEQASQEFHKPAEEVAKKLANNVSPVELFMAASVIFAMLCRKQRNAVVAYNAQHILASLGISHRGPDVKAFGPAPTEDQLQATMAIGDLLREPPAVKDVVLRQALAQHSSRPHLAH